jgi:GT2 family glycosyltransferase
VAWIDHSPTDASRSQLARFFQDPDYCTVAANPGFGAGHNRLMARAFAAGADHYLCLNPDAVLHPDCIAQLLGEVARQRRPGLVEAAQFPDEHPKRYDRETHATPWASGCALLVTSGLHAAIGGFDETFFMYCEDVDLSWRARVAGFSVAIAPRALVHHHVGDRPPGGAMVRQMLTSGAYLGLKYGGRAFTRHCLAELSALSAAAPELPRVPRPDRAMIDIADFSRLFHFAEARW